MSNAHIIQTGKLSDKKIIALLTDIEKEFGKTSSHVHLGTVRVDYTKEEYKGLFTKTGQQVITRGEIITEGHKFHIVYWRGISESTNAHSVRIPSPYFDEITITINNQTSHGKVVPIETIMEMKTTKEAAPPDAWIDATCRNLFDSRSNDDENRIHPIEAILSSSAKVEFGPDGAKFELGKKGARQLAKKVSNSG